MTKPRRVKRPYLKSGAYALQRNLPAMLDRAGAEGVRDDDLSPVEVAARELRESFVEDLGGTEELSTAQALLVRTVVGSASSGSGSSCASASGQSIASEAARIAANRR